MATKGMSKTRDSSIRRGPSSKTWTSDLLILIQCVLVTGLFIFGSCCRDDLYSQLMTETKNLKLNLGEILTTELQQIKSKHDYQNNMLHEKCKVLSNGQNSLQDEQDKLKEGMGQIAKHHTEMSVQLKKLANLLNDSRLVNLSAIESRLKNLLQDIVSPLRVVQTEIKDVAENIVVVSETFKQQEEFHRNNIDEIRRTNEHERNILNETFRHFLNEFNSKDQSNIEEVSHNPDHDFEWIYVCLVGVLSMVIILLIAIGSGRSKKAIEGSSAPVSIGPTVPADQRLTVVTFTRETYELSQTALPEMLGQSGAGLDDIKYRLLTGELDLSQIPSSRGYIVAIGYDARNSILEDMDGSMGSRKRLTIVGLQKRKREVLVIYIENDPQRREPPVGSLYNTHLGRPTSHPILCQLVDNQCFLSIPNWRYTNHQAQHIRKWVSAL